MRDVSDKVAARGFKLLNLSDITAEQKPFTLAIGHNLHLKNLSNLRDIVQYQRLGPVLFFQVACKLRMTKQVHDVAAQIQVTLQTNMLLGLQTGIGDLIMIVQRDNAVRHSL